MPIMKSDGYVANGNNGRTGPLVASLWCTEAVTIGDWIASFATDVTNPGAFAGGPEGSFRIGVSSNADAVYNCVGVALETTTAAGYVQVAVGGYVSVADLISASVAAGDDLILSGTAGAATLVGTPTANVRVVGQCITDGGSNSGSVWVNPHPWFLGQV